LLLPAGKLVGPAIHFFLQPQRLNNPVQISFIHPVSIQFYGQGNILMHTQHRNKVIALENEPNFPAPENGQGIIL